MYVSKEERAVCFPFLSFECLAITAIVLWRFLTVTWVGLQCVIVVFPNHTYFLFSTIALRRCFALY